jgi:hypothetical protein
MDRTDIGKSAAGAQNGERFARVTLEKEEAGRFFLGVFMLLLLCIEIKEYGITDTHFVNQEQAYQYPY